MESFYPKIFTRERETDYEVVGINSEECYTVSDNTSLIFIDFVDYPSFSLNIEQNFAASRIFPEFPYIPLLVYIVE